MRAPVFPAPIYKNALPRKSRHAPINPLFDFCAVHMGMVFCILVAGIKVLRFGGKDFSPHFGFFSSTISEGESKGKHQIHFILTLAKKTQKRTSKKCIRSLTFLKNLIKFFRIFKAIPI